MSTRSLPSYASAALARRGFTVKDIGALRNSAGTATDTDYDGKIPDSPEGLEALLGDSKKLAAVLRNGQLKDLVTRYAQTAMNRDADIAQQINLQVNAAMTTWLKENQTEAIKRLNLDQTDALTRPWGAKKSAQYNPRAMGASIDREFSGAADYFQTIWHKQNRTAERVAKLDRIRNAFSSTVPSEGGFLIPEALRSELLRVSLESAIVRPRARVIPMESLTVPFPVLDSTSNVSSIHGGVVAYWTEEGAQMVASSATFSRVLLVAKKLTAYTEVPDELIADSIMSFEAFISDVFPEALSWFEDDAFINGTGVGMPLGVLAAGNTAMVSQAKESGQAADTIVWENIIKMYARMLPGSLNRAVWVVSPDTFPELATMALSVGTGGSAVWLNNGVGGPPMTILGRPVIVSEKVAKLGDAGDINFIDFGHYLIGDRQVMSAASSEHFKFNQGVTSYRIVSRVDGRPWLQNAITPKNNSATLSPFVQLAARD